MTALTRSDAIQRMARGEKCETLSGQERWTTKWDDFDPKYVGFTFRIPLEPRREAREWWIQSMLSGPDTAWASPAPGRAHAREILPDEATLRRMTEDEALEEFQKWRIATKARYADMACYLAPLRALGLICERGGG